MLQATEVRKGNVVKYKDGLWKVLEITHNTPGNKRAIITFKMKNLMSGVHLEERFSSGDKVEQAIIDNVKMEYLYADGESLVFMNNENYEQIHIHKDVIADDIQWLKENAECLVSSMEGNVIGVELPSSVELKVTKTEPGLKGATATNQNKPATLETGAVVKVPPFIAEGETVRIDTRSGEYLERVNN